MIGKIASKFPKTPKWAWIGALVLLLVVCVTWFLVKSYTYADCIWTGKAVAWIDENRNGIVDKGEKPLPNVQFFVDDTHNKYTVIADNDAVTELNGKVLLFVWLPGCPKVRMEIYPKIPQGFELTTSPRLKGGKNDKTYEFGFAYLPGVPTATPNP